MRRLRTLLAVSLALAGTFVIPTDAHAIRCVSRAHGRHCTPMRPPEVVPCQPPCPSPYDEPYYGPPCDTCPCDDPQAYCASAYVAPLRPAVVIGVLAVITVIAVLLLNNQGNSHHHH